MSDKEPKVSDAIRNEIREMISPIKCIEAKSIDEGTVSPSTESKTEVFASDPATGEHRPFSPDKTEPEKKVPYSTQMRIEKAEEEAMYAKRGEIPLKNYYRNLEDIAEVALKEHNLQFHEYLSLARRRQALEDMRNEKTRRLQRQQAEELSRPGRPLKELPGEEEVGKMADRRLKEALGKKSKADEENKRLEQQLRDRDKEIERLRRAIEDKSPRQKAFERRVHRKQRRVHGLNNINSIFRFPLLQKVAGKLYEVDKTVSDFLLDIGNAEYVITKENFVSTAARRLMDVRAIDEPEYFFDEKGNIVSRWAYMAYNKNGNFSKLKKAKRGLLDLISNG